MEATLKARSVPWTVAKPHPVSGARAQPMHGPRFTAISHQV